MFTLVSLAPVLLAIIVVRLVLRALGFGRHSRRRFMGNGSGYSNGFGYGRGYGRRHRHGFGGGLFSILALVALDRLFRRW